MKQRGLLPWTPPATVDERFGYDAFGKLNLMTPAFAARTSSVCDWNFLFHAEFLDSDSGLYNYGYRYYHPELGRWISRDPIGEKGGINLYGFIANRPIYSVDLFGLLPPEVLWEGEKWPCESECQDNKLKIVAISNFTTANDRSAWEGTHLPIISEPIDNNQELIDQIKKAFEAAETPNKPCVKCIQELHISGHGSGGAGVRWDENGQNQFEAESIPDNIVDQIKALMCPGGVIRLWSCGSGLNPDGKAFGLQALANRFGHPASGVAGNCSGGINGGNHSGSDIVWRSPK